MNFYWNGYTNYNEINWFYERNVRKDIQSKQEKIPKNQMPNLWINIRTVRRNNLTYTRSNTFVDLADAYKHTYLRMSETLDGFDAVGCT